MESKPATPAVVPITHAQVKKLFNLGKDIQKEQETYLGRVLYNFATISPLKAYVPESEAKWAKEKMDDFNKRKAQDGSIEMTDQEIADLRKASRIYANVYHPDTKEKVLAPFRMSWFVPVNMPIIFGMLCMPQTLFNVIFFQWVNQTYNACWNYCNRNATCSFSNKELAIAYTGAVTSSIGVALLGRKMSQKFGTATGSISRQRFMNGAVAMAAMACAGFLNLYLIRYNEMRKGIQVTHEGKEYGISKKAATIAVISSASTRAVLPLPMLVIIPGLWKMLELLRIAPKGRAGIVLADMVIVAIQLTVSLPLALSLFTQELKINKDKLEPEFRNLKDAKGKAITEFTVNKGM